MGAQDNVQTGSNPWAPAPINALADLHHEQGEWWRCGTFRSFVFGALLTQHRIALAAGFVLNRSSSRGSGHWLAASETSCELRFRNMGF